MIAPPSPRVHPIADYFTFVTRADAFHVAQDCPGMIDVLSQLLRAAACWVGAAPVQFVLRSRCPADTALKRGMPVIRMQGLDRQVAEAGSRLLPTVENKGIPEIEEALSRLYDTRIRVETELSHYRLNDK